MKLSDTISRSSGQRHITPIMMIVIMATLLILASCGYQNKAGGQSSTMVQVDNQGGSNTVAGALNSLSMIDEKVGWAQSMSISAKDGSISYAILRTTDGGVHWKVMLKCAPSQGLGRGFISPCYNEFHSATIATVMEPDYDNAKQQSYLRIFHTGDGGQTWESGVIIARNLETPPTFVDGLHGWILATDGFPGVDPGSAYIGQHIALYRTNDGGKTWQRIASGLATSQLSVTSDDAYGIAPLSASARMQFVTASTGWLAGTSYRKDNSQFSWLYVTHDGGSTWQQVSISISPQAAVLWSPRFFNAQDGLLPVLTSGPAPQYARGTMIYVTHDGGQTWTSTTVPFDVTNGEFLDMNHAWTGGATVDDKTFYTTSDGWRHWTKGYMNVAFKRIYGFSFVSPLVGWALGDNRVHFLPELGGGIRKGDIIAVLKTTDGGQTWQEIAHSIV